MNIKVIDSSIPQNIAVMVDGWCNHGDSTVEDVDGGHYDNQLADHIDDWQAILVCQKCGAQNFFGDWL